MRRLLPIEKRDAIRDAFIEEFKKENFDGGLTRGVQAIERALEGASVGTEAAKCQGCFPGAEAGGGQSTMGTFLLIILGIFGVFLVLRLLGGLFGRSARCRLSRSDGRNGNAAARHGPGGPGYYGGGGGYGGGRGGGFFSGMLGGLGGALAGNWLYDQFSGRHGGMNSADAVIRPIYASGAPDQGGDAIVGADDDPGGGTSWDDGGSEPTPAAATGAAVVAIGAVAAATGAAVVATGAAAEAARRLVSRRSRSIRSSSESNGDHPNPRIRRGRPGWSCQSTSIQLLDLHVLEPAVAAVILKAEVAGAREFADGDVAELVARSVGPLARLVPLVQVDRRDFLAVEDDRDLRPLRGDGHVVPLAGRLLGVLAWARPGRRTHRDRACRCPSCHRWRLRFPC